MASIPLRPRPTRARSSPKKFWTRLDGKTVYICTIKAKRSDAEMVGSFGRYLAVVYDDGESINDWLLETGHAAPRD